VHIEARSEAELRSALERLPDILNAGTEGTFASSQGKQLKAIEVDNNTDAT
jgi:hypothetical protein